MSPNVSTFKPYECRAADILLPLGRETCCSRGQFSFYDVFRSRLSYATPSQLAASAAWFCWVCCHRKAPSSKEICSAWTRGSSISIIFKQQISHHLIQNEYCSRGWITVRIMSEEDGFSSTDERVMHIKKVLTNGGFRSWGEQVLHNRRYSNGPPGTGLICGLYIHIYIIYIYICICIYNIYNIYNVNKWKLLMQSCSVLHSIQGTISELLSDCMDCLPTSYKASVNDDWKYYYRPTREE